MAVTEVFKKGALPDETYLDIEDVPVEATPVLTDGDNTLLENRLEGVPFAPIGTRALSSTGTISVVPFTRVLFFNKVKLMRGKDVFAVSRALARAGFRKWGNFTYFYGNGMEANVKKFQQAHGLTARGTYNVETHKKLSKYFDAYGTKLMVDMQNKLNPDPREVIKNYAVHGFNNRELIHYTQGPLRMYGVKNKIRPPKVPLYEDCSSFATWCYWGAGVKDPNNLGYNGYGYTGTLALNGARTYSPRVGDLAFYGSYPYTHVVVYIGDGKCISHGSEGGPYLLPVMYRSDFSHYRTYI